MNSPPHPVPGSTPSEDTLPLISLATQLHTLLSIPSPSPSPSATSQSFPSSSSSFSLPTLPLPSTLTQITTHLPLSLPIHGHTPLNTAHHLLHSILPALNNSALSPHYYGFVTGGVFPIAEFADNVVSKLDQNVQVHLPAESACTVVEERAGKWLVELLGLGRIGEGEEGGGEEGGRTNEWRGRIFTTGATAGNVLGLACGREVGVARRLNLRSGNQDLSVGELGLLEACSQAGVKGFQILTSMGHSSLSKAAAVVGLGRAAVKDVGAGGEEPWRLDLERLEQELSKERDGIVSVVVVGAGEVNTGRFATDGLERMKKVRALCDRYRAWLHIDGAFGIFARCLPATPEFASLIEAASGLELADSIAGDCHKMLNVPYDCGFFLTRSVSTLSAVFQNPNAAYLSTAVSETPSPLNIGLENSRRFRALPVYAVLMAYGRDGLAEMFARQVRLARGIRRLLEREIDGYEVLGTAGAECKRSQEGESLENTHIVVLFRAKDEVKNGQLVKRINETRKIYVSGTKWAGKQACRFAVSTWKVDVERDLGVIKGVLESVL